MHFEEPLKKEDIEEILKTIDENLEKNYSLFCNYLQNLRNFIIDSVHPELKLNRNCSYYYKKEDRRSCNYSEECFLKTSNKGCYFQTLKKLVKEYYQKR